MIAAICKGASRALGSRSTPMSVQFLLAMALGALVALNEMLLPAGAISAQVKAREQKQSPTSTGESSRKRIQMETRGVVHAGEFQRMVMGPRGVRYKERNPSRTESAHLFRIFLHPSEAELDSAHEQMRFPVAQRHNLLCVIASPDGAKKIAKGSPRCSHLLEHIGPRAPPCT